MKIVRKKLKDLSPAKYNPRVMGKVELKKLEESIKKYGLVEPIIINKTDTIIGGHQRRDVALKVEIKEADCVVVDLSEEDEKKLNLALNKIKGSWDYQKLDKVLSSLRNLNYTGFDMDEIKAGVETKPLLALNFYVNLKDYKMLSAYFKNNDVDKLKKLMELRKKNGI